MPWQSSAYFRPDGRDPEALEKLLKLTDSDASTLWKATFDLIVEWKGPAASFG